MIIHVDMDAFFASVEQRDRPELRGKPVAVGGSASGRGVVAAASYEARRFGVHSAMSGRRAAQLCPQLIFVRSRFQQYSEVSHQVREIFQRYTPIIQPLSVDEAFLDVRPTLKLFPSARDIGLSIQQDIRRELDLPCSVGIAPRKFLAKIASDLEKPEGLVLIEESEIMDFLAPLPIARLWGVGKVTQARLTRLGVRTIQDLRRLGHSTCQNQLGQLGDHLWRLANGQDARSVVTDHKARQIGHERTFHQDVSDDEFLHSALSFLAQQVARRLRHSQRRARQVSLKYRLHDFQTFSRNHSLPHATHSTRQIEQIASELLNRLRREKPQPVRLIGISLGQLTSPDQQHQRFLFDQEEEEKQQSVDALSDQLYQKFGQSALYRATGHQWAREKQQRSLDSPNRNSTDETPD